MGGGGEDPQVTTTNDAIGQPQPPSRKHLDTWDPHSHHMDLFKLAH